jgi:hypothetical protein
MAEGTAEVLPERRRLQHLFRSRWPRPKPSCFLGAEDDFAEAARMLPS